MKTFSASQIRIYFNRGDDAPKVWSVDFGPGTVEILCESVTFTAGVHGETIALPGTQQPKAWIELSGVQVSIDGAQIQISQKLP